MNKVATLAAAAAFAFPFAAEPCFASDTTEAPAPNELYILNQDPPGISVVDMEHRKLSASIPLDEDYEPEWGVLGPNGRFLYVIGRRNIRSHRPAPSDPGKLWVVELSSRKVLQTIAVDPQPKPKFVKEGGYLEVGDSNREYLYFDTQTNQLAAKLPLPQSSLHGFVLNRDGSKIFALYSSFPFTFTNEILADKKLLRSSPPLFLRIFSFDSGKLQTEIELPGSAGWAARVCCGLVLSSDGKWLYLVGLGKTIARLYESGIIYVIDAAEGKLVTQFAIPAACGDVLDPQSGSPFVLSVSGPKDTRGRLYQFRGDQEPLVTEVGADPFDMRRVPNQAGFWVISHQDMRFLADGASSFSYVVLLNRHKNIAPPGSGTVFLDGYPGDILYLPTQNRLVMGHKGKSDKLAMVNLTSSRIERIVTVGRSGIKAKNVGQESLGMVFGVAPGWERGGVEIASRADGKFVYALHAPTADVTVIQVQDSAILDRIPVEGVAMGVTANGRFVYTYGLRGITWIDTQTNKKLLDYHPDSGKIEAMQALANGDHVVTLTAKSLLVWNAMNGHLISTIEGLHGPSFLVQYGTSFQKKDLLNPGRAPLRNFVFCEPR